MAPRKPATADRATRALRPWRSQIVFHNDSTVTQIEVRHRTHGDGGCRRNELLPNDTDTNVDASSTRIRLPAGGLRTYSAVMPVELISAESTELFTGPPDEPLQIVRVAYAGCVEPTPVRVVGDGFETVDSPVAQPGDGSSRSRCG